MVTASTFRRVSTKFVGKYFSFLAHREPCRWMSEIAIFFLLKTIVEPYCSHLRENMFANSGLACISFVRGAQLWEWFNTVNVVMS